MGTCHQTRTSQVGAWVARVIGDVVAFKFARTIQKLLKKLGVFCKVCFVISVNFLLAYIRNPKCVL